jgi:aminomethyltransferase
MSEEKHAVGERSVDERSVEGGAAHGPLHAEHVALGAAMTPFAGWSMPLRYTSDLEEHHAVRRAAGLFDLSHMGEIRIVGVGAGAALDRALVGNLSALGVGRARYTMICAPDGGVLDDLVVYRPAQDEYLVVANASNVDVVLDALVERCAGPEVAVLDESEGTALVAVQGPAAEGILAGIVADPQERDAVVGLKYYACTTAHLGTRGEGAADASSGTLRAMVARTGYTGEDGFELYVPAEAAVALWRTLLAEGASAGLVPAGLACRDSLRLEAGMPLYGNELDRTTTPYEAGLGRVVKLDKVDADGAPLEFVGRGPLAARAGAQPARVLVGLEGLGRRAARHGYPVTTPDGTVVGEVTSGAPSPTLGHPIAMAYVTPELSAVGTDLAVDVRGRSEPVRVVALPFYRR